MKKPKKDAPVAPIDQAAERPRAGGSYVRDRATGELTRVPHPKAGLVAAEAEPTPAPAPEGNGQASNPMGGEPDKQEA